MSFSEFSSALRRGHRAEGRCLIVFDQIPSTHLLARRLVEDLVAESSAVPVTDLFAWSQSGGRGRQDRPWSSPAGQGVYLTLLRSLTLPVQQLPLLVAVAVADVINRHLEGRCRLKWPNDLMVEGRKLGGILIDVKSGPDESPVALISFGVNVTTSAALLEELNATSLSSWNSRPELAELARELVASVDFLLALPPADLVAQYRSLSAHEPGQTLRCRLPEGDLYGRFLGIDDAGFLRLEVDGQERLLVAGELHE